MERYGWVVNAALARIMTERLTDLAQMQALVGDVKDASGKTLSDIATAQNISSTQLQTIVGNAIQNALKPAVTDGTLTKKQVDKLTKRFQSNPVLLDHLLTIQ